MAPHRTQARAQRGFTLIEMAIAVAIFGTLASGAILATSAWLGKQALDKTHKNLDRIESALTLYVVQNGRLPCPYDPAAAVGTYVLGGCPEDSTTAYVGLVPYRDLGLQRTDVLDGWNRYVTYAVDGQKADSTASPLAFQASIDAISGTGNPFTALGATADSQIEAQDENGAGCKTPDPDETAVCAAYVLISHGEAGRGGYINFGAAPVVPPAANTAERLNSPTAPSFDPTVYAAEPAAGDQGFDHIVRFRTAAQILRDIL